MTGRGHLVRAELFGCRKNALQFFGSRELLEGESMLASYQEELAREWDTDGAGWMERLVDPSLPSHQPVLTPVAMLCDEILESCCIRPVPQHAFEVCDINPGD